MNVKLIVAFLFGAALASGIVYLAVRPDAKPQVIPVSADSPKPAPQQQAAQTQPEAPPRQNPPEPEQAAPPSDPPARQHPAPAKTVKVVPALPPAPPPHREPVRVAQVVRIPSQDRPSSYVKAVAPAKVEPEAAPQVETPAPQQQTPAPPPPPQPEKVEKTQPPPPAPEPPPQVSNTVTIAAGTSISVRIGELLSTKLHKPGDTFLATLDRPLEVEGFVIAERGARCEGRVTISDPGGRTKGVAELSIELISVRLSDGQRIRIHTSSFTKDAEATRKTDAAKVGGGAALGAIIGAIAGGGKGAAIGAGAGTAAGAGDVMLTRGKPAEIPVETQVIFRVQDAVTVTEQK